MAKGMPFATLVAVVVLGLVGAGSISAAALINKLFGQLELVPGGILILTFATLVVFGMLGMLGAFGMWRGAAWGWVVGLAVCVAGSLAIGAVMLAGVFEPPMIAGIGLFALLAASLLAPSVRRRAGIGLREH
jgi:hypothetical protein